MSYFFLCVIFRFYECSEIGAKQNWSELGAKLERKTSENERKRAKRKIRIYGKNRQKYAFAREIRFIRRDILGTSLTSLTIFDGWKCWGRTDVQDVKDVQDVFYLFNIF